MLPRVTAEAALSPLFAQAAVQGMLDERPAPWRSVAIQGDTYRAHSKLSGHPSGEVLQLFFCFGLIRPDRIKCEVVPRVAFLDVNGVFLVNIGIVPVTRYGRAGSRVWTEFVEGLLGSVGRRLYINSEEQRARRGFGCFVAAVCSRRTISEYPRCFALRRRVIGLSQDFRELVH